MSPISVGRFHENGEGNLVLELTYPCDRELLEKPELAIGSLVSEIFLRDFELRRSGQEEAAQLVRNLLWEWVYRDKPLSRSQALDLAAQLDNQWDRKITFLRVRRKGRPVKSRHIAIQALFRKHTMRRSWEEVTRRLCPCGKSHNDKLTLMKCQSSLESEVRHLKRELRKYRIDFPPHPSKRVPAHKAQYVTEGEKKPPRLDESSGAARKPSGYTMQHPVIGILVNGDFPEVDENGDPLSDFALRALSRFNPYVLGWIPIWFPELCTSDPIESRAAYQERRYKWFEKVFKQFAGSDWPLKGPLEAQRKVIVRVLIDMYRAACDDAIPWEETL